MRCGQLVNQIKACDISGVYSSIKGLYLRLAMYFWIKSHLKVLAGGVGVGADGWVDLAPSTFFLSTHPAIGCTDTRLRLPESNRPSPRVDNG